MIGDNTEESATLDLLNAICQREFFEKNESKHYEKSAPFARLTDEDFLQLCDKFHQIIKTIAASCMDFNQLQAFLTSRTKHREPLHRISEQQAKVIAKFWKTNKTPVVEMLTRRTKFNPELKSWNWRLETTTSSRTLTKTASVVVQITLENHLKIPQDKNLKSFELEFDAKGIAKLCASLNEIDEQIQSFANVSTSKDTHV